MFLENMDVIITSTLLSHVKKKHFCLQMYFLDSINNLSPTVTWVHFWFTLIASVDLVSKNFRCYNSETKSKIFSLVPLYTLPHG